METKIVNLPDRTASVVAIQKSGGKVHASCGAIEPDAEAKYGRALCRPLLVGNTVTGTRPANTICERCSEIAAKHRSSTFPEVA